MFENLTAVQQAVLLDALRAHEEALGFSIVHYVQPSEKVIADRAVCVDLIEHARQAIVTGPAVTASQAQINRIMNLLDEKDTTGTRFALVDIKGVQREAAEGRLTHGAASDMITLLKKLPRGHNYDEDKN